VADGPKGLATLQFGVAGENQDTDQLWSGIASAHGPQFRTWIYSKCQPRTERKWHDGAAPSGSQAPVFVAQDWERSRFAITVRQTFQLSSYPQK